MKLLIENGILVGFSLNLNNSWVTPFAFDADYMRVYDAFNAMERHISILRNGVSGTNVQKRRR